MSVLIKLPAYQFFQKKQILIYTIAISLVVLIIFNIILDYSFTQFQDSAFYITESLLFSSHWTLYLPLLFLLLKFLKQTENIGLKLTVTGSAIVVHLLAYPALVWLLSKTFYYHTFNYWQTFYFGLSAYFIISILIYGFSLLIFTVLNKKTSSSQINEEHQDETKAKSFITSIIITDNNNIKSVLAVNDIFYISANSPYVSVHHLSKKYLYNETLKFLENQLDKKQFIRIHKSHIINLQKVISYQSRQNGDYDVSLSDGRVLRISRNYAKDFKSKFEQHTHLTAK